MAFDRGDLLRRHARPVGSSFRFEDRAGFVCFLMAEPGACLHGLARTFALPRSSDQDWMDRPDRDRHSILDAHRRRRPSSRRIRAARRTGLLVLGIRQSFHGAHRRDHPRGEHVLERTRGRVGQSRDRIGHGPLCRLLAGNLCSFARRRLLLWYQHRLLHNRVTEAWSDARPDVLFRGALFRNGPLGSDTGR